jgi:hypothetical protein
MNKRAIAQTVQKKANAPGARRLAFDEWDGNIKSKFRVQTKLRQTKTPTHIANYIKTNA